jgi:cytochrome c553
MASIARRFELFGRAATAGRYELADYQLGELEEDFSESLPAAAPPHEGHPEVLPTMATAFTKTTLPDLKRSLVTRDAAQITASFARAAAACNGCHQASGHGFIEVPTQPGRAIPNTDPTAAPKQPRP